MTWKSRCGRALSWVVKRPEASVVVVPANPGALSTRSKDFAQRLGMDAARRGYYHVYDGAPGLAWLLDGFTVLMAERGLVLSGEQADALAQIMGTRDLGIVVGHAGTGKSAMLGVAREAGEVSR